MRILDCDLEDIQQVLVEILLEIDRVCKKHKITYTLAFGTLLGAVRHRGFIPWDDDLDIAMLRSDYDKFIAVCKEELGAGFFLTTTGTEEDYPYNFAKVVKEGTIFLEKGFEYRNVHKGIYVDVFPLDRVDIKTYAIQRRVFSFFRRARWYCIDKNTMPREVWKKSQTRKKCWFAAPFSILGNRRLNDILEKIMRCYDDQNEDYVYVMCHPDGARRLDKLDWYKSVIFLEFEGYQMPCPLGYKKILRQRYGEYRKLPPVEQRKPSHNIIKIGL